MYNFIRKSKNALSEQYGFLTSSVTAQLSEGLSSMSRQEKLCISKCKLNMCSSARNLHCDLQSTMSEFITYLAILVPYADCNGSINPLKPELIPICYLLALLGAHHFLHVSRIKVKLLTLRRLMSYIYGAPILDVSRSHTTTQHSR